MPNHVEGTLAAACGFTEQAVVLVAAPREQVFAFIDDPNHLGGHMSTSSWRLGGGRMRLRADAARGRRVGSRMALDGRAFGMRVSVHTEVVEREPPERKAWQTTEQPHLLVIGSYRISVRIDRVPAQSRVTIRIDYGLPAVRHGPLFAWLARVYARWCVRRMAAEIATAFVAGLPSPRLMP